MAGEASTVAAVIPPNPATPYIQGAAAVTDIIGLILNYGETQRAQKEARQLNQEAIGRDIARNAFSEDMQGQNLKLAKKTQKESQALNEKQFTENKFMNTQSISNTAFDQMQKVLSNDVALRNNVLKLWA